MDVHQSAQTIVAIPFFLPGHTIPLLRLCKHLVESTGSRVALLKVPEKDGEEQVVQNGVQIIPCLKMPHFTTLKLNLDNIEEYFKVFNAKLDDALDAIAILESPISCIISDVYVGFAQEMASRMGIPWIALWTSTAAELLIYSTVLQLMRDKVFPFAGPDLLCIPGLPPLKQTDYPTSAFTSSSKVHLVLQLFTEQVQQAISKSQWLLLNSVHELEKDAIDALQTKCNAVPIGPLHLLENAGLNISSEEEHKILAWLDGMPKSSVLYIAMGTTIPMSAEQFRELAFAVDESGLHFVWSVRQSQEHLLPDGFQERTYSRGLVVPWAPQMKVLQHPSTAGFFTHCGWNSTLEAISAGVPMITRPLIGDQALTRKFVLDVWGVGLGLNGGDDLQSVVSKVDIKTSMLKLFESNALKDKVKDWRQILVKAVLEDGSSWQGLNALSHALC